MPNLATVPAGEDIARQAAIHLLATLEGDALRRAVLIVPNRRSIVVMRESFRLALGGKSALLPRIMPLADIDGALVNLLGDAAFTLLESIPPAMPHHRQRYLLTEHIQAFERKRIGGVSLHYALTLADKLMALQERCARAQVTLTHDNLRSLVYGDFARHYEQSLLFLGIISDSWPALEREMGCTIAPMREVALISALARHWKKNPPDYPVVVIGSTGSQTATAQLLHCVADMPHGLVIIPALDTAMPADEWAQVTAGHPLFHLKSLLDRWPIMPAAVKNLVSGRRSLWLDALAPTAQLPYWRNGATPDISNLRLIACAHAEEEVRVISLLLREALENPQARVALITPDEGLMTRVASHMQRFSIQAEQLNAGTLATTHYGSLWTALLACISNPARQLLLRDLLHHKLLAVSPDLLRGLEKGWHGVNRTQEGRLPRHDPALHEHPCYAPLAQLVHNVARLSTQRMTASAWLSACGDLLSLMDVTGGQGYEAVTEQLDVLSDADSFGALDAEDFVALLAERLATKWRDAGLRAQQNLFMLTPVEARLEQFDRIILANMQESVWPGLSTPNPWLNRAAQQTLGLPGHDDTISRMAHDILMLASAGEVFLTYPLRDAGSPTTRSRFIERLVTLLSARGIAPDLLAAPHYIAWANMLHASDVYAPESPVFPTPGSEQRPRRLSVSDLDRLFTDPFSIYARHVLSLRPIDSIDASPEASDFGSLAHKAIESLTLHWNKAGRSANAAELEAIASHTLRDFSERPNVDLFWRARLLGGLRYVNSLEEKRRNTTVMVAIEQEIEASLTLADGHKVALHGRLDRIEMRASGATVIDYKSGNVPGEKKILEGRALQLLAYAILLARSGVSTQAVEYWALPKLGDEGAITHIDTADIPLGEIEIMLSAALSRMLDARTPFLARPYGGESRFDNDYDGISRYDEWAG